MTNKHLTEEQLQQCALDTTTPDQPVLLHLEDCNACRLKAAQYLQLFQAIKVEEKPAFDFDLTKAVMAQLPKTEKKGVLDKYIVYILSVAGIVVIAAMLYGYGSYLLNLFSGNAPLLTWCTVSAIVCLSVFLCMDMYQQYKKKMDALNFY